MEKFEYKVFSLKREGLQAGSWYDGLVDLGPEITCELLIPLGKIGWEVVTALQSYGGMSNTIILKRLLMRDLRG